MAEVLDPWQALGSVDAVTVELEAAGYPRVQVCMYVCGTYSRASV